MKDNKILKATIIVPVHNEEESLEKFIKKFLTDSERIKKHILELILVENGSTDNTPEVCKKLSEEFSGLVKSISIKKPSYGEALKAGISNANGDFVTILESDVMDPIFFERSIKIFNERKADFVVASKRHPESVDSRPFKRRALTFLFNLYLKMFFRFKGSDTHGLKSIKSSVAKELLEKSITTDEIFQTEIVLLADILGYSIVEVPLNLKEMRETTVSITKRFPKVMNLIAELRQSTGRFK